MYDFKPFVTKQLELSLAYVTPDDMKLLSTPDSVLQAYEYQGGVYVLVPYEWGAALVTLARTIGHSENFVRVVNEAAAWLDAPSRSNDRQWTRWIKFDVDAGELPELRARKA
jgi:hypothetical protein